MHEGSRWCLDFSTFRRLLLSQKLDSCAESVSHGPSFSYVLWYTSVRRALPRTSGPCIASLLIGLLIEEFQRHVQVSLSLYVSRDADNFDHRLQVSKNCSI